MAETQLKQARANLATAQSRLGYTVITAPRDGMLISRDVERGNVVQPGKVLMMLSPVRRDPARRCRSTRRTWGCSRSARRRSPRPTPSRRDISRPRSSTSIPASTSARLRGGEAARAQAAGLPEAGHDGLGRHRGRRGAAITLWSLPAAECMTRDATRPGCWWPTSGRAKRRRSSSGCVEHRQGRDPRGAACRRPRHSRSTAAIGDGVSACGPVSRA